MTEAKHTPGPWAYSRRAGIRISAPDGRSICAIAATVRRPPAECEANAQVIAAAPELLASLIWCEALIRSAYGDTEQTKAMRKVIAKATGESK